MPVSDNHIRNWFDCIKSRERPIADVEIGHLGNIVRWVGRKLQGDSEQEIFPGDDAANAFRQRPQRVPYQLPL